MTNNIVEVDFNALQDEARMAFLNKWIATRSIEQLKEDFHAKVGREPVFIHYIIQYIRDVDDHDFFDRDDDIQQPPQV